MQMDYGYNSYIAPNYNYSPKPNYNMGGMISPPANNSPWLYVPTVKDVQSVQVQPGQKAWVMVQNDCVFALRSADNMGIVTTDFYRFEKIDAETANPQTEYVTRKEWEEFLNSIKGDNNGKSFGNDGATPKHTKVNAGE